MACDACKGNPSGKWYQIVCTTADARSVEVLCEGCHSPEQRMARRNAEVIKRAATALNRFAEQLARSYRKRGPIA